MALSWWTWYTFLCLKKYMTFTKISSMRYSPFMECKVAKYTLMMAWWCQLVSLYLNYCWLFLYIISNILQEIFNQDSEVFYQKYNWKSSQVARFMGPTWGPPGSCRPQMAICWPHEPCYQGCLQNGGFLSRSRSISKRHFQQYSL